jgi:FKBP-type peptidyl-prolyl cis-trans isomerase
LKRLTLIISSLLFFIACQDEIDGYKTIHDGVHIKLISFEDEVQPYPTGNYIKASFEVSDSEGIKFRNYKYIPFMPTNKKFDKIFTHFNKGDSLEVLVSSKVFNDNDFGFIANNFNSDSIKVNIKVHDFLTQEEYSQYLNDKDDELVEQQLLKQYLLTEKDVQKVGDIYYSKIKETTNKNIERGDVINIKYVGSFINGVVFDTTFSEESFEFTYGTPNQVIEGFEKVLKVLKNGEKAKIIIPSQFAFGDKGSSTGIVPPSSTVIYNIEIINIK